MTPTGRPSGQMLAMRMRSMSGYSSGEESPSSFRRITSFGSATSDSCNSLKFAVSTPKGMELGGMSTEPPSYDMLVEMCKKTGNDENRPPSPRPTDSKEMFVEHNKQMHVWDNWLATTSPAADNEFVSTRYRRTASKNVPKALPKVLELEQSDDSDF